MNNTTTDSIAFWYEMFDGVLFFSHPSTVQYTWRVIIMLMLCTEDMKDA